MHQRTWRWLLRAMHDASVSCVPLLLCYYAAGCYCVLLADCCVVFCVLLLLLLVVLAVHRARAEEGGEKLVVVVGGEREERGESVAGERERELVASLASFSSYYYCTVVRFAQPSAN